MRIVNPFYKNNSIIFCLNIRFRRLFYTLNEVVVLLASERFYHTQAWKQFRRKVLMRDHFYCVECARRGRTFIPANTVHHKIPRDRAPELALEMDNAESVCATCHNKAHPEKAFRKKKKQLSKSKRVRIIRLL